VCEGPGMYAARSGALLTWRAGRGTWVAAKRAQAARHAVSSPVGKLGRSAQVVERVRLTCERRRWRRRVTVAAGVALRLRGPSVGEGRCERRPAGRARGQRGRQGVDSQAVRRRTGDCIHTRIHTYTYTCIEPPCGAARDTPHGGPQPLCAPPPPPPAAHLPRCRAPRASPAGYHRPHRRPGCPPSPPAQSHSHRPASRQRPAARPGAQRPRRQPAAAAAWLAGGPAARPGAGGRPERASRLPARPCTPRTAARPGTGRGVGGAGWSRCAGRVPHAGQTGRAHAGPRCPATRSTAGGQRGLARPRLQWRPTCTHARPHGSPAPQHGVPPPPVAAPPPAVACAASCTEAARRRVSSRAEYLAAEAGSQGSGGAGAVRSQGSSSAGPPGAAQPAEAAARSARGTGVSWQEAAGAARPWLGAWRGGAVARLASRPLGAAGSGLKGADRHPELTPFGAEGPCRPAGGKAGAAAAQPPAGSAQGSAGRAALARAEAKADTRLGGAAGGGGPRGGEPSEAWGTGTGAVAAGPLGAASGLTPGRGGLAAAAAASMQVGGPATGPVTPATPPAANAEGSTTGCGGCPPARCAFHSCRGPSGWSGSGAAGRRGGLRGGAHRLCWG
jgi:hypothetical protein